LFGRQLPHLGFDGFELAHEESVSLGAREVKAEGSGTLGGISALQPREEERPREPKSCREVRAREHPVMVGTRSTASLPGAGSGIQGVGHLIQFVRNRLHLGLGGRIGNRLAQRREGDETRTDVVEVVLDGLELAAQFARDQR